MRTCVFDLETFTLYADTGILLCCSFKEYGIGNVVTVRADSFPEWDAGRTLVQRSLCAKIMEELKDFDIFIAHNGMWFDRQMLISWGLKYQLPLFMRFAKFIDPVQIAKRHLRLSRNNLQSVLDFLDIDEKKTHLKWDEWTQAAYDGNRESMNYIVEHCEKDVISLEKAHQKMRKLVKDVNERGSSF